MIRSSWQTEQCKILFLPLSDVKTFIFSPKSPGFTTAVVWKTLPKSTKTHRREGSHSRRGSECVCVSEGVWESEGASQIEEEERESEGGEERREQVWTRWSSTNKPPRGCRVVSVSTGSAIRPWCPRAARDPVPCWLWHSSWDAAWLPASARTTRSPSCSKGSVWWCATRTLPRTVGSPPHLAYQSAPLGQRWLFPLCVEPTTSRQRWATRPWPSTLTRSDVYSIQHPTQSRQILIRWESASQLHLLCSLSPHHTSHLFTVGEHNLFKLTFHWFHITAQAVCDLSHDCLYPEEPPWKTVSFIAVRNWRDLQTRCQNEWSSTHDHLSHMRLRASAEPTRALYCICSDALISFHGWGLWTAACYTASNRGSHPQTATEVQPKTFGIPEPEYDWYASLRSPCVAEAINILQQKTAVHVKRSMQMERNESDCAPPNPSFLGHRF